MSALANKFRVAIFDDFFEAFGRLPQAQQKKVREFLRKFRSNPTDPAINYEKIQSFVDPNLRTVRIGLDYRAIILKPDAGNVFGLLWVDHHDEAMAWAKNKRVTINPEIGAIQIYDVVEAQEVVEAEKPPEGRKSKPLFKSFKDTELIGIGVPEGLLPLVRSFTAMGELEAAQKQLPPIAWEGLAYLANDETLEEVRKALGLDKPAEVVAIDDFDAALDNDSSKQQFFVVDNDAALEAMLDAPLEKWRVFLHPSQRQIVERPWSGPVRVLGGAGTGKTVVAMHRAAWLAKSVFTSETDRILFTTFTKNLADDISENLDKLLDGAARKRVEVLHLDAWVRRFLKSNGYPSEIAYFESEGPAKAAWEHALASGPSDYSPAFYREEWERVVLAQGCATEADYLKAPRVGRGLRLERSARKKIWPVFETYRRELESKKLKESSDAVRDATQLLRSGKGAVSYRAVIVDEAQDLPTVSFELIRAMVPPGNNDLFIVGDGHQRIYGRMVNLGKAGIQIVGRSKRLRINYRTTEQIRQYAVAQLEGVHVDDLDDGMDTVKGYRSLTKGPPPAVTVAKNFEKEVEAIIAFAKKGELSRTCVVARTNPWLQKYAKAFEESGIKIRVLSRDVGDVPSEPGLRLATMHRVKGLEFDRVVIAAVNDGVVPLASALTSASDDAARSDVERQERSLFYVALTRARREVLISSHVEASKWLSPSRLAK